MAVSVLILDQQPELRSHPGWSRFVREKGLVTGDTIAFSQEAIAFASSTDDGEMDVKRRMFIECRK